MAWNIPSLDPAWASVLVAVVLAGITLVYAIYTKKMVDLAQKTLLYQRKPNVTVRIENDKNDGRSASMIFGKNMKVCRQEPRMNAIEKETSGQMQILLDE